MATFSSSSSSSMLPWGLKEPRWPALPFPLVPFPFAGLPLPLMLWLVEVVLMGKGSTLHSCFFFNATPLALILWPNVSAVRYLYCPFTRPTVPDHILSSRRRKKRKVELMRKMMWINANELQPTLLFTLLNCLRKLSLTLRVPSEQQRVSTIT